MTADTSALRWRTSSLSNNNSTCVAVALSADENHVHVRNSNDPQGAFVTFTRAEWSVFISGTRTRGEFDLDWLAGDG